MLENSSMNYYYSTYVIPDINVSCIKPARVRLRLSWGENALFGVIRHPVEAGRGFYFIIKLSGLVDKDSNRVHFSIVDMSLYFLQY